MTSPDSPSGGSTPAPGEAPGPGSPGADGTPAAPPAPPGRTRTRALAVLAVVFFVGAVAMGALAAALSAELGDERDDRRAVERTASLFAERLLTFDYRRLDEARRGVFDLSTGRFRKEYEQAFEGLGELIGAGETVQRGTVREIYVGTVSGGSATVIAVAGTVTTGRAGPRSGADSYIELDLVKVEGRWLVDGVTNLNFTRPAGTTPSTTAPPENPPAPSD